MMLKNKLKIVSLLSSAMLWLYVIAIVNPDSTSSLEGLTVNISNTVELAENNLILSSESKPTVNLTLEGKISDLRKLKKENIRASIEIQNPAEGKNEATINVTVPTNVRYKLEEDTIMVQLEKTISKEHDISISLPKDKNINDYSVSRSINSVKVSGPRSVVNKVDKVVAIIKDDSFTINKNIGVQLKAIDLNGNIVENATLENSIMQIKLNKIEQKEVYVEPVFKTNVDKNNVVVNPEKIIIYGEASVLEKVDRVYTKPINIKDLKSQNEILIEIELPEGLSTVKNISADITEIKNEVAVSLKKD